MKQNIFLFFLSLIAIWAKSKTKNKAIPQLSSYNFIYVHTHTHTNEEKHTANIHEKGQSS